MLAVMKKKILIAVAVLVSAVLGAKAQTNIGYLKDVSGNTVELRTKTELVGDPYLTKDWSRAIITTTDGKKYQDVPIKYDQIENVLYFKDTEGNANKFVDAVKEFVLVDEGNAIYRVFAAGNKFFYHILYDGKTKFVHRDAKYLKENREYNSAITTQKVASANKYYIVRPDHSMEEVKLNKKSILAVLANKEAELTKYVNETKPDLSTVEGFKQLLAFYDQL